MVADLSQIHCSGLRLTRGGTLTWRDHQVDWIVRRGELDEDLTAGCVLDFHHRLACNCARPSLRIGATALNTVRHGAEIAEGF